MGLKRHRDVGERLPYRWRTCESLSRLSRLQQVNVRVNSLQLGKARGCFVCPKLVITMWLMRKWSRKGPEPCIPRHCGAAEEPVPQLQAKKGRHNCVGMRFPAPSGPEIHAESLKSC